MGRKVYVTSDMSIDEQLIVVAEQDPKAALIWPWILTYLDDWGRGETKPREIKAKMFPCNDLISYKDIENALRLYAEQKLLILYEVNEKQYMSIYNPKTWFKWQTHIHKAKRVDDSGSKYPRPVEHNSYYNDNSRDSAEPREKSREIIPSTLPPFHPTPSINSTTTATDSESENDNGIQTEQEQTEEIKVFKHLESVWGKPLTFHECETLTKNINQFKSLGCRDPDLIIIEAIRRSDNAGIRTMRYIDGILLDWQKRKIITIAEIEADDEKFQKSKKTRNKASPGKQKKTGTDSGKYDGIYL